MSKPCIKCGAIDRTPRGDCRACARTTLQAWKLKNASAVAEYAKAYNNEHREEKRTYNAQYGAKHRTQLSEAQRERHKADPEKYAAREAARYHKDPTAARERHAAYIAAHPEKVKQYRAADPEATRRRNQNRRALRVAVGGTLSKGLASRLYVEQKGLCACCAQPLNGRYHMDHIMPLSLGGANADSNIQLLLPRCNVQKKDKHPDVFKALRAQKN